MQFRARNALPGTPPEIDAGAVTAADVCAPAEIKASGVPDRGR